MKSIKTQELCEAALDYYRTNNIGNEERTVVARFVDWYEKQKAASVNGTKPQNEIVRECKTCEYYFSCAVGKDFGPGACTEHGYKYWKPLTINERF